MRGADMAIRPATEKGFLAAVVEAATLAGWRVYHTHDSRKSAKGFPDLVCCRGARLLFIELKMPGRKATPEQVDWLVDLAGVRAVEVFLWTPDDWPQIEVVLGFRPAGSPQRKEVPR